MRHPIELAVQQVLPIEAKPHVTAQDAATVSRPFALLLSEAEAVHDHVRLSLAAQQAFHGVPDLGGGVFHAVRDAWNVLSARMPWGGVLGMQVEELALSRLKAKRR